MGTGTWHDERRAARVRRVLHVRCSGGGVPFYKAITAPDEVSILAAMKGRSLLSIATDGWSVACSFPERIVRFFPDEVATPDALHPHADVVRVRPALGSSAETDRVVAHDLGNVVEVRIQAVRLTLSEPVAGERVHVGGVEIPAGVDYHHVFVDPDSVPSPITEDLAVVEVDAVIVLLTGSSTVRIGSDTVGFFIFTDADPMASGELSFPDGAIRERVVGDSAISD